MEMDIAFYQGEEEGKAQLRERLTKEAINFALQGRWEEAEALNRDIVEKFPSDAEAYNRLGRALTELGDFGQALEAYSKALELAPENAIARKNVARLTSLLESTTAPRNNRQGAPGPRIQARRVAPDLFITEAGKGAVVTLRNIGSGEVLAKMGFGDQVNLEARGQRLIVTNKSGEYLGEVEAKQASRLTKLMRGGNRYDAAMLNVEEGRVQVLIKEVYQHPSQAGLPSFPVRAGDYLYTRIKESLLRRGIAPDESEVWPERADSEEEDYPDFEEGQLPEGFTILGEDTKSED